MSILPKVPETCMMCGAPWIGGCQVPGERFQKTNLRVFYGCGARLAVLETLTDADYDCYFLLRLYNCQSEGYAWEEELRLRNG
jgi:hypothetical protein